LYEQNLILRPCCYSCRFASLSRVSDITIGDFWGINKIFPEFDDNKGVSLVLINTFRGNAVFHSIQEVLEVKESNNKDCLQQNLIKPAPLPANRGRFWKAYLARGFLYAARKYAGYSRYNIIKYKLRKQIKKLVIYPYLKRILRPDRRS
jgi:coenzyme F420-reducing hydrogenase beta subunit